MSRIFDKFTKDALDVEVNRDIFLMRNKSIGYCQEFMENNNFGMDILSGFLDI